jgi:transposase
MECSRNYIGIDISKETFDVAIGQQYTHYKFSNEQKGFKALLALLAPADRVVMEASGPYYMRLACFLFEHGVSVSVINPLVIRRFCQMRLIRAKTDKKDAKMIAMYGAAEQPAEWAPEPEYVMELRQLQAAAELLGKNRTALLLQQEALSQLPCICKEAANAIKKVVKAVEKQLAELELKTQQLIELHHQTMYERLQTIPGLGKKSVSALIILTGGFTRFANARQLCSYIGTCPRIFESGTSIKAKSRITKMGMSKIRAMLYVCAWSAKKYNQKCNELYQRLVEKGKCKKLALIAVVNKLLKQAFAIATTSTNYDKNYAKNVCF